MTENTSKSERLTRKEAQQKALKNLHEWNKTTGAINEAHSWMYELQSIIVDAVNLGMNVANEPTKAGTDKIPLDALVSTTPVWKDCDEELPEYDSTYLILVNGKLLDGGDEELTVCKYSIDNGWMFDWYSKANYKVTHWMELPEPPQDKT